MQVKDLIKKLESYRDFDLEFQFTDGYEPNYGFPIIRVFQNIDVDDIGHSDKIVLISGEEK